MAKLLCYEVTHFDYLRIQVLRNTFLTDGDSDQTLKYLLSINVESTSTEEKARTKLSRKRERHTEEITQQHKQFRLWQGQTL